MGRERARRSAPSSLRAQRTLAFVAGFALPTYLALNGGGYAVADRGEAGLVLWWGLSMALAFGFLPVARMSSQAKWTLIALAALVGWSALSLLWTSSAERTLDDLTRLVGYAGVLVLVLLAVTRETFRNAAAGLTAAAILISAIAVLSRLAPGVFPEGSLASAESGVRLFYPLGYWNALACWSGMAIVLGLAWSSHGRSWHRRLALAAVPVAVTALSLTYSRAGIALTLFGVAALIGLSANRWTLLGHAAVAAAASAAVLSVVGLSESIAEGSGTAGAPAVAVALAVALAACYMTPLFTARLGWDRRPLAFAVRKGVGLAAIGTLAVATLALGPGFASEASQSFSTGEVPSGDSEPSARLIGLQGVRSDVWTSAASAFESEPLLGIGPGTFEFWWTQDRSSSSQLRDAHSLYLETLAELGLPGLLMLLTMLGLLTTAAFRAFLALKGSTEVGVSAGLLAASLIFFLQAGVDWLWETPAVAVTGLAALALVAASAAPMPRRRRRFRGWALAAVVGGAAAAGALQVPVLIADQRVRVSQVHLLLGNQESATKAAQDAIDAAPWASTPREHAAYLALTQGELQEAESRVKEAIDREPLDWRHEFLRLRIALTVRDDVDARDALGRVVELNPSLADEADAIRREVIDAPAVPVPFG